MAQIPSRSGSVVIRDWAIVDMLGAVKLAFLGLLARNHTIQGEGGYVVICQTDKKRELQTSIKNRQGWRRGKNIFFSISC